MQISLRHNIRRYTKMLNHPSIQEWRAKYFLSVCLGRVLTILYTCLPLLMKYWTEVLTDVIFILTLL